MRALYFLAVLAFLLSACGNSGQQTKEESGDTQNTENTIVTENLKTLVLDVHGMTCTGCEEAVKGGVSTLAGISAVSASHTDSIAVVTFDPGQTSVEEIQNAITGVGYTVAGFEFKDEEQEQEQVSDTEHSGGEDELNDQSGTDPERSEGTKQDQE